MSANKALRRTVINNLTCWCTYKHSVRDGWKMIKVYVPVLFQIWTKMMNNGKYFNYHVHLHRGNFTLIYITCPSTSFSFLITHV